jgi:hypothetical protein
MRTFKVLLVAGMGSALSLALADDGAITWSGAPKLLSGHPSIRMVSEKIILNITKVSPTGDGYTDADCTFVFKNDGPACSVRIGFPDRTRGAFEQNYAKEGGGDYPHPTFQTLTNFKSWVNGVPVKTTVVLSQDPTVKGATYGGSWHAKTVSFKAGETVTVRDTYRQPQSGGASSSTNGLYLNQVQYIMSTGASWRGPIGSVVVEAHLRGITVAKPLGELTTQEPYSFTKWDQVLPNEVYYLGFGKPWVSDGTITFRATNLKPTVASDINLFWPEPPHK